MEKLRLTRPGGNRGRGERARLYVRWMPHIGAEAVALYELLRVLPDIGSDETDVSELSELLRSTPENVEASFETLLDAGFVSEREGWFEVAEHPPSRVRVSSAGTSKPAAKPEKPSREEPALRETDSQYATESRNAPPEREIEVVKAEPEGVSAEDYFRYMGSLPAPHIIQFLNGYSGRDGVEPDVVREALKIASERDARRVGYVRSILERWVERGVKTLEDVNLFEQDRKLRLVEQSGAVKGGALSIAGSGNSKNSGKSGKGVGNGSHRQAAARPEEGYEWLFGQQEEQ